MRRVSAFVLSIFSLLLFNLAAPAAHAQITNGIEASITHPFVVGSATLPPGRYIFRMAQATDLRTMTVTNAVAGTSMEVLVRQTDNSDIPKHSELVFNRYGDKEFLTKIFEAGARIGVAVDQSPEEAQLQKQGQKPVEHTEEQEH
jgi:hypothetical protein